VIYARNVLAMPRSGPDDAGGGGGGSGVGNPCPSPTLPCLPALLVLLHSLFLHPHQVTRELCHVLSWLTLTVTVCLY